MLSVEAFAGYVREALLHVYDRAHLRSNPLGPLLGSNGPLSEDELRQLLLGAVEALRPPEPCPPSSPAARRHRYLELRYLKGATPERTAHELQISVRQSQRERERALDDVTAVLWERYRDLSARKAKSPLTSVPATEVAIDGVETRDSATIRFTQAGPIHDDLSTFGSLPSTEPISLAQALRDALDIVARLLDNRGARVDVVLPDHLPLVVVHRQVLRQVLIDLLESAIESQVQARIRVRASAVADRISLELSVPGPNSATRTELPEIDARLAAARRLVELQAGQLVEDRPECVAFRVILSLPLARTRTLLVIDDNPDVAFLFSRLLRDYSFHVLQASTGSMAIQLAHERRPDAITLDVLMPSQDGWDLLRSISEDPVIKHIPVIICSVLPERSLALSLGVAEFLNKPVTQDSLLAALHRCVPA